MHGPALSSVTGTTCPSGRNTCVIPIFLPRIPGLISKNLCEQKPEARSQHPCCVSQLLFADSRLLLLMVFSKCLDFDIHTRRQIQLHQGVNSLLSRLQDVQEPLMRADLKLFPRFLVDVRRAQHGRDAAGSRQRNGPGYLRTRPFCRVHDFGGGLVQHPVIVRLQSNAYAFSQSHRVSYSRISVTVPAPTVRPPSRMANRSPLSMATGVINSTSRFTLSPGITISVPSGNCATPVTSVVRK